MTRMMDESLEFHEVDFSCTQETVARRQFRIQVRGKDRYFLDLQASCYPLLDISEGGVSVAMPTYKSLPMDGLIANCTLVAGQQVFQGLDGQIVHYSLGSDSDWICGIEWLNLSLHATAAMNNLLNVLRVGLFDHE
ncbi:MAG: hypothetical protein ACI9GW_001306 [Halieaceae bacterium]|jgi:hypothetical protein